jgi:hypothetical protein
MIAALFDELSFASCAKRFAMISADRSSVSEQLLSKHLRLTPLT